MKDEAGKTLHIFVCETFVVEAKDPEKVVPDVPRVISLYVEDVCKIVMEGSRNLFARPPTSGGTAFNISRTLTTTA